MFYDSHVHLTDREYSSYLPHILFSLRAMRINACSVAVDLETTINSFSIFKSFGDIITNFVGIHPEFAQVEDVPKFLQTVYENLSLVGGIGEVGLDKTYADNNYDIYQIQKRVFQEMLDLAQFTKKPVSIHSRKSLDDVLDTLASYKLTGVLLHWFAGSRKQLKRALDMGLYVSYGPALLYASDKKVLLKETDKNKILVETDGPVRYSHCFNGLPAV